jgi:DNA-binding IclR family transcriptional regulator
MLLGLVEEDFVLRSEADLTYTLGPELITLGRAADRGVDLVSVVEPELDTLSSRFQVSAIAAVAESDHVAVIASRSAAHPLGYTVAVTTTLPLRAPVGPVYVAWSRAERIEGWLDRADPPLDSTQRKALLDDLATVRRRGWSATITHRSRSKGDVVTRELRDRDIAAEHLEVLGVSAPVLVEDAMICSLALVAIPDRRRGEDVVAMGEALRTACRRVSDHLAPGLSTS